MTDLEMEREKDNVRDYIFELEHKIERQKRLINAQNEYIEFLADYIDKTSEFLRIHHQGCPGEIVMKGKELREKINKLKGE